jgi:hypothetical protein
MLRYIIPALCAVGGQRLGIRPSPSFYSNSALCGGAGKHFWCNAPKYP